MVLRRDREPSPLAGESREGGYTAPPSLTLPRKGGGNQDKRATATRDLWLSDLFARPAWRIEAEGDPVVGLAATGGGPAFLFARVPTSETAMLHRFEALGFRVVDVTVTLEAPAESLAMIEAAAGLREAVPADRTAVCEVAAHSFDRSRLHLDPLVPRALADRSRAEWAGNYFAGKRGDAMIVAEPEGHAVGFLLLLGPKQGVLTIDLVAVAEAWRRHGLGAAMIGFAARRFGGKGRLRVGTQAANIGSLAFYERLGFRTAASHYVLHLHRG